MSHQFSKFTLCFFLGLSINTSFIPLNFAETLVPDHLENSKRTNVNSEERYEKYLKFYSLVRNVNVRPHWLADGNRFWYAEETLEGTEIYIVDPKQNTKLTLFDKSRLRIALRSLLGHEPSTRGIPFNNFRFVDGGTMIEAQVEGKPFRLGLSDYRITELKHSKTNLDPTETSSPDGKQYVFALEHNLWLRNASTQRVRALTNNGIKDNGWNVNDFTWSPNGKYLLATKSDSRAVHHLPVLNYSKALEDVEWVTYAKTGGAIETPSLYVIDVASKKKIRIDVGAELEQYLFPLGWRPDGQEVFFIRLSRNGKCMQLLAANPQNGSSRVILSEQRNTFVGGLDFITENWRKQFTLLKDGRRFVWISERDGWKHFYLYDLSGKLLSQLTKGPFPVIQIIKIDEEDSKHKDGWLYFTAHAEAEIYDTHLYRMSLSGGQIEKLTQMNGKHDIQFSPSGKFFLDAHSSPQRRPVLDLMSADGELIQTLKRADTSKLDEIGWNAPEEFVVKAADGKTDMHGILYKPYDFDPTKKYPVVEFIYAGPFMRIVPSGFSPGTSLAMHAQALAQLGYVTFLLDSRGTTERDKEFQDAVYGNIGKFEIPDHVTALKQLGEKRLYLDLNRVGIYGHSWGGYFAVRAMLLAPEIYRVGIASAPGELTEGAEINEPYMGLLQDNRAGYEYGINLNHAAKLQGKLLFIHGTADTNAPFSTSVRMIEALIKAGKPYDLLLLPQRTHFFDTESYANDKIRQYFDDNLRR